MKPVKMKRTHIFSSPESLAISKTGKFQILLSSLFWQLSYVLILYDQLEELQNVLHSGSWAVFGTVDSAFHIFIWASFKQAASMSSLLDTTACEYTSLIISYFNSAAFFPRTDMMITTTLCSITCLLAGHWAMLLYDPWKFLFIFPYAFPNVLIYSQWIIFLFASRNFFFMCSPAYVSSPTFPKMCLIIHGSGTRSRYLFQHQVYNSLNVGSSLPPREPVFASERCSVWSHKFAVSVYQMNFSPGALP